MLMQWKDHRRWFWISFITLLGTSAAYTVYALASPNGPHGGTVPGLLFGIAGTLLMVFAGLLAARKRLPHWRLGSAKFWLKGHLWLGTLSVPLILFHAGFGWGGPLENWLWITFGLVIASGFLGVFVQQFLPRLITSRVPQETFVLQVPYQCRRMQLIADRMVSGLCDKVDIGKQPLADELRKLAQFAATASRDEMSMWADQVQPSLRGLFLDVAKTAKQAGRIRLEDDFPKLIGEMYIGMDFAKEAGAKPQAADEKASDKPAKPSPLEQMRAKQAAKGADAEEPASAKPPAKKKSPLELARAQASGKKDSADSPPVKKKSPLELAREQQAAKKEMAESGTDSPPAKKKSPLEIAREQQAAKKEVAESGTDSPPAKKKSPLELAREQQAAKKGTAESGTDSPPAKKKSPLELAREQQAAKKAAAEPAAEASPAAPSPKPAPPKAAPSPWPDVDSEQDQADPAEMASMATINFTPELALAMSKLADMEDKARQGDSDSVMVPCPDCGHELRLPDRGLLGRKARCPLCSNKFVLTLPEPPTEAAEEDEEATDEPPLMTARVIRWVSDDATGTADAGKSALDVAKEKEAAKRRASIGIGTATAEAGNGSPPAKKSALERAREQAPKAKTAAGPAGKPSPLEQMKAKAAAGKAQPAATPKDFKKDVKKPKKRSGPIPRADKLREFYENRIRPFLDPRSRPGRFPELSDELRALRLFAQLRSELPSELHEVLEDLENFVTERRQFTFLIRIHKTLHYWLLLHIPISMALYVLTLVHIVVALRVVPPF